MDATGEPSTHGRYEPRRRSGYDELPGLDGKTLLDYWSWAYSDIIENVQRAVFAEFLVASALGLDAGSRVGWRSYDLLYGEARIEVKASAYIQSWHREKPSNIVFGVGKRLEMDDETTSYGSVAARNADIWVFALFEPQAHGDGDVVDARLWRFYVVRGRDLETSLGNQKSASLATIEKLADPVRYRGLKDAIDSALGNYR